MNFTDFSDELRKLHNTKYLKWYISICTNAFARGNKRTLVTKKFGYVESHHFIPKCVNLKYANEPENKVFLTAREHFICHYMLCRIFTSTPHYFKLLSAFGKMSCVTPTMKNQRYMNSRLFELFRINSSEMGRHMRKDKIRIKRDDITKEISKDLASCYLSDGWVIGAASTVQATSNRTAANKKRSGFAWMYFADDIKSFQVRREEIEAYKLQGALVGRVFTPTGRSNMLDRDNKRKGIVVTNEFQTRRVSPHEAAILLAQGWRKGRGYKQTNFGGGARIGTKWYNDGCRNYKLLPIRAYELSLTLGRLKGTRRHLKTAKAHIPPATDRIITVV